MTPRIYSLVLSAVIASLLSLSFMLGWHFSERRVKTAVIVACTSEDHILAVHDGVDDSPYMFACGPYSWLEEIKK